MISIVNNQDQFNTLFPTFKEQSKISSNPDIYMIGLDCEFISKANNEKSFNKVDSVDKSKCDTAICTIQIANQNQCIILNMTKIKILPCLFEDVMISYNWIKTGVGINGDIGFINSNFGLNNIVSYFDLKLFGELCGIKSPSLKNMYESFGFGFLDKDTTSFDWTKDLTLEQLTYAGKDGFASYLIGQLFIKNMIQNVKCLINSQQVIQKSNEINITPIINIDTKEQNYVGILQEYIQKNKYEFPEYIIKDHNVNIHPKEYICICQIKTQTDNFKVSSISSSKKNAKNETARLVCQKLKLI